MRGFTDCLKKYYPFTKDEMKSVIISIIVLTFIVAFNDNREIFSSSYWIGNFLLWFLIVGISFIIGQSAHRIIGAYSGYKVEFQLWWYGIIISLILMLVTRGNIWVLIPGGIWIHHLKVHRIGKFRYGPNLFSFSMIALSGPISCILFAGIIKTIEIWFGISLFGAGFVDRLFLFNMAYAAYSLIPIPPLPGSIIFFQSRVTYVFIFATVAVYALLVIFEIYSYIFAIIIGIIFWLLYFFNVER